MYVFIYIYLDIFAPQKKIAPAARKKKSSILFLGSLFTWIFVYFFWIFWLFFFFGFFGSCYRENHFFF